MQSKSRLLARRNFAVLGLSLALAGWLAPRRASADQSPASQVPGQQATAAKKHPRRTRKAVKPAQSAQAAPSIPPGAPEALPLDQIPSSAPQVNYDGRQLTIVSRNSTLGDIMRAVQTQTGAVVEMPSNSTERVVGLFGPGPARDVLASLLNGSHFNYVLLGSPANAAVLDRVVLITKSGPDEPAPTVQASAGAAPSAEMGGPGQDADSAADSTDDAPDDVEDSSSSSSGADDSQPQPVSPPGVRTPEQLLQELQRQQMIQQQQNGTPQSFPSPQPLQEVK